MQKTKRYAHIDNPTIAAIVHEMYRFESAEEAEFKIVELAQHFVAARKQIPNTQHPTLILWIKGYALTPADEKAGIIGNFAVIAAKKTGNRFTLSASKMDAPAGEHPQRGQVRRDNPNWGHPVLRAARKGKVYGSVEEAQAELDLLHEHYPSVSIPNPGLLYIMIYCADRPARERMVKFVITIKQDEAAGGYVLECKENTYQARPALPRQAAPKAPPKGKFTAKVAGERRRRKPKA